MGIKGLLPLLSPITQHKHLSTYAGKTVGVDASCWLHRSAYTCAYELHNNITTYKYVLFLNKLLNLLLQYDITPYIVFDGQPLPAKANENNKRTTSRQQYKQQADALLAAGNRSAAYELYQRCVPTTSSMKRNFISLCQSQNIKYIVAHSEADAQLAYLYKRGMIDYVLSEDSDILAFGVNKLLCKLDMNGYVKEVDLTDNLATFSELEPHIIMLRKLLQLRSSDPAQYGDILLEVCVLAGCDYLNSPTNIAIKKAVKLFSELFQRAVVLNKIRQNKSCKMSADYEQRFDAAVNTFKHQYVIDPHSKTCVHFNALPATSQPLPHSTAADKENVAVSIVSDTDSIASIESIVCNVSKQCTDLSAYIGSPIHNDLVHDYMGGRLSTSTLTPYTHDKAVLSPRSIRTLDSRGQLPAPPASVQSHSQPVMESIRNTLLNAHAANTRKRTAVDDTDVLIIQHKKHTLDVPDLDELFTAVPDAVPTVDVETRAPLQCTAATSNPFKRPRSTSTPYTTGKQASNSSVHSDAERVPLANKTNSLLSYFQR